MGDALAESRLGHVLCVAMNVREIAGYTGEHIDVAFAHRLAETYAVAEGDMEIRLVHQILQDNGTCLNLTCM